MSDPIIPPTPLPPSPALPQRSDPETFEDRVDAAYEHMFEVLPPGLDVLAGNVYDNALAAEQRALTADTRAEDAATAQQGAEDARDKAQDWAEGVEPEPGAKSARQWSDKAQEWAESDESPEPGSKSAKGWAGEAEDASDSAWAAAAAAGVATGLPEPLEPGKLLGAISPTGVGWVAGLQDDYQEFTTSGTWEKPEGAMWVYVEAIAGGGGGQNSTSSPACGASGGECVDRLFRATDLAATEAIVVGAGGPGGASGAMNSGVNGGDSSFGSFLRAIGGKPGSIDAYAAAPRTEGTSNTALPSVPHVTAGYGGRVMGGKTIRGGGGGGGGVTPHTGGESEFHGNGGNGNDSAGIKAGDGQFPGGGGGGSANDGGGGDGAPGVVRAWCW